MPADVLIAEPPGVFMIAVIRRIPFAVAACLALLAGCAAPSSPDSMPNMYQRAKVLSKDDFAIRIEHSDSGKALAARMAQEHCAELKKTAVYGGGVVKLDPDMTSIWRCE
jgi:hypothetical protein